MRSNHTTPQSNDPRSQIELVRTLGKGGMATVHEAVVAGRRVALKRPRTDVLERRPDARSLFEREYQTLAQLAHPNIIEVYGYGIDQEGPYYTMELLEGGELGSSLPLPWKEACRVLRDVAAGLAMVHSRRMVHRDVSLRNVRLAADGKAKLMDFGAMVPMGVPARTIGTPAYIPPEALYQQALDARTDLYALGALGYRLLTGRDAYPARRIPELRDVWRSLPRPLTHFIRDVPAQLDELIRQLLSLNPDGRCRTAAEVFVRVSSVAGLHDVDDAEIAQAYLTTPSLVGREHELMTMRRQIMDGIRGRGSALLVEGASGLGRSRLLDACILDAQLAGAQVARVAVGKGSHLPFGLLGELAATLVAERPDLKPSSPRLRQLIEGDREGALARDDADAWGTLQRELRDWLLRIATRPLLIVVDDLHLADVGSAAVLAGLVDTAAERRLIVIASAATGAPPICEQALHVVRSRATRLELAPLSEEGTMTLVRSLFDDVVNVQLTAQRIYEVAQGNPRGSVDLAEWLVDGGHVVHEGGRWLIPDTLAKLPLPDSVEEALRQRLAGLSDDAVALGAAIAVLGDAAVPTEAYAEILDVTDIGRVQAALAQLLSANVVTPHGEGHVLAQQPFRELSVERLSRETLESLHRRIGRICLDSDQPDWGIYHLFRGGARDDATDLLIARLGEGFSPTDVLPNVEARVGFLRDVLEHCRRRGRPAIDAFTLQNQIVVRAEIKLSLARDVVSELSEKYKDLVGYTDWAALPADMDRSERLSAALRAAEERHERVPEHDRLWGPVEALPRMARFIGHCVASGAANAELALLEGMPPLEPFIELSDALRVMARYTDAVKNMIGGQIDVASRVFTEVLEELDGETGDKLGDVAEKLRRHTLVAAGMINAGMGRSVALDYADRLDATVNAGVGGLYAKLTSLRIRHSYHLRRGNWRQAERWERQVELEKLRDRTAVFNPSATYALSWIYATVGNVAGMRDCLTQMKEYSNESNGLKIWLRYIEADYDRLRGDYASALPKYQPILETQRGRHMAWSYSAYGYLLCLEALGRFEEGKCVGEELLERADEAGLTVLRGLILRPLGLIEARLGNFERSRKYLTDNIERSSALGMCGLNLGVAYEFRARIAILAHDREAFERDAAFCADQYRAGGGSPSLTARYDALLDAARRAGLVETDWQAPDLTPMSLSDAQVELRDRLMDCPTSGERCRQALVEIMKAAGADRGYLFGVTEEGVTVLAANSREPVPPDASAVAARYLGEAAEQTATGGTETDGTRTESVELRTETDATRTETAGQGTQTVGTDTVGTQTEDEGAKGRLWPYVASEPGDTDAVAVFLLSSGGAQPRSPERDLLEVVALALITAGDVVVRTTGQAAILPGLLDRAKPVPSFGEATQTMSAPPGE